MNHFGNNDVDGLRSSRPVRFGLPHLFLAMLVFSVAAWAFSLGFILTGVLWLGWSAGVSFSRRNRYSPLFMGFVGMVIGLLYLNAVGSTMNVAHIFNSSAIDSIASKSKTLGSEFRLVLICLAGTLWVAALATTFWLVTSIFRRYTTLDTRETQASRYSVSDRFLLGSVIAVVFTTLNLQARNIESVFFEIDAYGWPFTAVTNHSVGGISIHWVGSIVNIFIGIGVAFAFRVFFRRWQPGNHGKHSSTN